jgi:iron only hydrogenase large subunit-like protein
MTCPGGCIAGGGQPLGTDIAAVMQRMQKLYAIDRDEKLQFSHHNPDITRMYNVFLGKPLGEKSHHLLHTTYRTRDDVIL